MDFEALAATVGAKVYLPGSDGYTESAGSYFSAFENELRPAAVVQPSSTEEVVDIIKAIREPGLAGKVKVAIRGGGHTPWAGSANIHDGLVIDLRKLTGAKVDQEKTIVSIGAGERWGNVYKTLGEQGLATYGGRVSSAGCAGLILGGELRSI
jgi:FAD/FMN-containing dehydrogenase